MINLPLTVISDTTAGLVLGWTPPPGAEWYTLYTEGVRVSNHAPVDKQGVVYKQVKFAAGKNQHQVVCNVLIEGVFDLAVGTWDRVVVPPPVTQPPVFAGTFEPVLSPLIAEAKNAGGVDTPNVVSFGTWLKVQDIVDLGVNAGRIDLPAAPSAKSRAEFKTPTRPNTNHVYEVYSLSFYVPPGWNPETTAAPGSWTDCVTLTQHRWCGSPLAGAPVSATLFADHVTMGLNAGSTDTAGRSRYNSNWDHPRADGTSLPGMLAVPPALFKTGVWQRLIVAVDWSTDPDGSIQILHQIKGDTNWTVTVDTKVGGFPAFATLAYAAGNGGVPPVNCYDKWGLYRWTHSDAPIWAVFDNLCRYKTITDAKAFYGTQFSNDILFETLP